MSEIVRFKVMREEVLGLTTYRGTGKLSDISRISAADIFDQKHNPAGTQRDLNINHAKAAYEYVTKEKLAFWPEVVLCCRSPQVLQFRPICKELDAGFLEIDLRKIKRLERKEKIAISRLDGNHRLHFALGNDNFKAIDRPASFCILIDLDLTKEIKLFKDINNNQRRMNTSHLDTITIRLTPEERLMQEKPALYIAKQLGRDPDSPFYNRIFEGGKKKPDLHIPLNTLHTGINYLMQRSSKFDQVKDVEAEYLFIKNYWIAVKDWTPGAWEEPKKYLLLRGAGLWGACMLGGIVIDKCLDQGKYTSEDMLKILESGDTWDWTNNGDFKGYSGRGGAVEIANKISATFSSESGVSIRSLVTKIKSTH